MRPTTNCNRHRFNCFKCVSTTLEVFETGTGHAHPTARDAVVFELGAQLRVVGHHHPHRVPEIRRPWSSPKMAGLVHHHVVNHRGRKCDRQFSPDRAAASLAAQRVPALDKWAPLHFRRNEVRQAFRKKSVSCYQPDLYRSRICSAVAVRSRPTADAPRCRVTSRVALTPPCRT
jgi:hypothetical protein